MVDYFEQDFIESETPPILRATMATEVVTSKLGSAGTALLDQLAALTANTISPETARILLQLRFHGSHQERFNQLSAKTQEGTLDASEQDDLDDYIRTADVLAVIQSRARQALRTVRGRPRVQ